MRTLASGQDALALARDLAEVKLLTITTYSDRAAGTVADTFYFSDETVSYDGDTYSPLLADVSSVVETMAHVPTAQPGDGGDTLSRRFTFELVNGDYQGDRLINTLEGGTGVLEYAHVEYSTVLIPPAEKAQPGRRTISGTGVHQVWFRGIISRGPVVDASKIVLEAETEPVQMPWVFVTDSLADPRDLGKRLPEVYGEARLVEGVLVNAGKRTTLAKAIDENQIVSYLFADVLTEEQWTYSDFAASPNEPRLLIDGEVVRLWYMIASYGWVKRGADGTTAAPHQAGAIVQELRSSSVFAVAGHECEAVGAVYLRNLHNGQLWRVPSTYYSVDLADTTTISGATITSVTFTTEDLKDALLEASTSSLMTEQASYSTGTPTVNTATARPTTDSRASNSGLGGRWQDYTTSEPYYLRSTYSGGETLTRTIVSGDLPTSTDTIVRWRFKVAIEVTQAQSWGIGTGTIKMRATFKNPGTSVTAAAEDAYIQCSRTEGDTWTGGSFSVGDETTTVYSDWYEPDTAGTAVSALVGAKLEFLCKNTDRVDIPSTKLEVKPKLKNGEWGLEVEHTTSTIVARTSDAALNAAAMGHDLQLFADVSGHEVPTSNTTYSVSAGTLIEHPADIIHHLIAERAGLGDSAVDHANTFDDAVTNLGSGVAMGFDARLLGWTWEEIVRRIAWEARGNLVPTESVTATVYKLHTPESDDTWPAASGSTISDFGERGPTSIGRSRRELASSFSASYGLRPDMGDGEEAFTKLATKTVSSAEDDIGEIEFQRFFLLCFTDQATASHVTDWLDYMGQEHSRIGSTIAFRSEHWDAYTAELGDIRNVLLPWKTSATKCRLVEFSQTDRDGVQVRFVEVL